jgi:hypothetical protein
MRDQHRREEDRAVVGGATLPALEERGDAAASARRVTPDPLKAQITGF